MRLLSIFLYVVCTACVAQSSVWKVSKNGHYFYLGGTVHLLEASDHPLPKEFHLAYQDAQHLIFETDISESETPAGQQQFLAAMMDPSGQLLSQKLSVPTYTALSSFLQSRGLPIDNFALMKPWAVALMMTMVEYQKLGLQPEYGVDRYFYLRAQKDNKRLGSLETLQQQISYLATMEEIDANQVINYTLQDLQQLPEFISFMKKAWRTGYLEDLFEHELTNQMKKDFPDFYNTLITTRNVNWLEPLVLLNDNDVIEFVLVGSMHLNGKQGLLMLLENEGFKVQQL